MTFDPACVCVWGGGGGVGGGGKGGECQAPIPTFENFLDI